MGRLDKTPPFYLKDLKAGATYWKERYLSGYFGSNYITLPHFLKTIADNLNLVSNDARNCEERWNGGDSFEQILEFSRVGWQSERAPTNIEIPGSEMKIVESLGVEGAYPDVATYLSGDPECLVGFNEMPVPARFCNIKCDVTASGSVNFKSLLKRGKVMLGVIDSLEAQGIRCKLSVTCTSEQDGLVHELCILLKDYQDPMDEDMVSFCVGHPAFFRNLIFAYADIMDTKNIVCAASEKYFGGIGRGRPYTKDVGTKGVGEKADLHFPAVLSSKDIPNIDDVLRKYLEGLNNE